MSETGKVYCLFRSSDVGKLVEMVNELVALRMLVSYSGSPQQLTGCNGPSTGHDYLFAMCQVSTSELHESVIKNIAKFPAVTVAISGNKGELCQCPINARCVNSRFIKEILTKGTPVPTFKGYQPSSITPPTSPDDDEDIMDITPNEIAKANESRTTLNIGHTPTAATATPATPTTSAQQAVLQQKQNLTALQIAQMQLQQQLPSQPRVARPQDLPVARMSHQIHQAVNMSSRAQQTQQQILQQLTRQRNALLRRQQAAIAAAQANQQTIGMVRLQPPAMAQRPHPYQPRQMPKQTTTSQLPQRPHVQLSQTQPVSQPPQRPQVQQPVQTPAEKPQHISVIRAEEQLQLQLQQSSSKTQETPQPVRRSVQIKTIPVTQRIPSPSTSITVKKYLALQAQAQRMNNANPSPVGTGGGAIRAVLNRGRPPAPPMPTMDPRIQAQVYAAVAQAVQHVTPTVSAKKYQVISTATAVSTPSTPSISSPNLSSAPGPSRRYTVRFEEPVSTGRGTRRKAAIDDDDYTPPDANTLADVRCNSSTRPKRACTNKNKVVYKEEDPAPREEWDDEKSKRKKDKNTEPAYAFLDYRKDSWKGYDLNRQKPKKPPTGEDIDHYNLRTCETCNEWVPKREFLNHALEVHGDFKRYRCEGDDCTFQTMFYKKARNHLLRVHNNETRAFDWKMDNHFRGYQCQMIRQCFPVEKFLIPLRPINGVLLSGCDRHSVEVKPDLEPPSFQDISEPLFYSE